MAFTASIFWFIVYYFGTSISNLLSTFYIVLFLSVDLILKLSYLLQYIHLGSTGSALGFLLFCCNLGVDDLIIRIYSTIKSTCITLCVSKNDFVAKNRFLEKFQYLSSLSWVIYDLPGTSITLPSTSDDFIISLFTSCF